jgi:hypothetical protein
MMPFNVSKLYANFTLLNVKYQETFPNVIGVTLYPCILECEHIIEFSELKTFKFNNVSTFEGLNWFFLPRPISAICFLIPALKIHSKINILNTLALKIVK